MRYFWHKDKVRYCQTKKTLTYNSVNGWQSYTLLLLINFPYFQPNKCKECIITWDSSLQSVKSSLMKPLISPWPLHLSSPAEAGCGSGWKEGKGLPGTEATRPSSGFLGHLCMFAGAQLGQSQLQRDQNVSVGDVIYRSHLYVLSLQTHKHSGGGMCPCWKEITCSRE